MELLGHSISHFVGQGELDRKLMILHLANAVELTLKDMVLDSGDSIYKNPKETINIWTSISKLKERQISVPCLNKIELLIDERNALQHRFGSPNELATIFYMNIATEFFRIALHEHYDQDFDEILEQFTDDKDLLAFRLREPRDESELEHLVKLALVHPLGALLSAMAYKDKLEADFGEHVTSEADRAHGRPPFSFRYFEGLGIMPEDLFAELEEVRHLRNVTVHGRAKPTVEAAEAAVKTVERYETFLNGVGAAGYKEAQAFKREELLQEVRRELEKQAIQHDEQE
jgi:uncharacterized protein YutE (UPF0331/DUF86 family)